jgi:DNA helicase HerA-like ATPase
MSTAIEQLAGLAVGTVESVSPNEIRVVLNPEAPQSTALNTGIPIGFPKLNSYVLIPNEAGAVVGLIAWLGLERSTVPRKVAQRDSGLIDLPFPTRHMTLTPVGTLVVEKTEELEEYQLRLRRGVSVFPSVGDQVLLPTAEQLRSIIESQGSDRRVAIGTSPLAGSAVVSVDPDKLFGRHLAVLGNTGSGKSCSVAGLIRWSLQSAAEERTAAGREGPVNARFIILDPNGEYLRIFSDMERSTRVFQVPPVEGECLPLALPAWMWNSHEWAAFAGASPQTQRPLLLRGLRDLRAGKAVEEPMSAQIRRPISSYKVAFEQLVSQGIAAYTGYGPSLHCGSLLRNLQEDAGNYVDKTDAQLKQALTELIGAVQELAGKHYWKRERNGLEGFRDFSETDIRGVIAALSRVENELPEVPASSGPTEDAPIAFDVPKLPEYLDLLSSTSIMSGNVTQFIAMLTMRIRMMLADRRLGPLLVPESQPKFGDWLESYIGADQAKNGQIAILDLSLVPSDVLHIVIAVIARIVFEATQRFKKLFNAELPTILVLEEAHTFIQSSSLDDGGPISPAQMCRHTFERIAREGRKFGLGLVLSSQRPSELSPTVLAQCNTFLLHRIVNDRDQELVKRLVPDALGGLLRELPSLPTRQAIILGWATPMPVLVEVSELPESQRPQSSDPKFWSVWTGREERPIDWEKIQDDWTS